MTLPRVAVRACRPVELDGRPDVEHRQPVVAEPLAQLRERHVFHWLRKSRRTALNRSGWSTATKCPAPGNTSSLPSSADAASCSASVDRDELVAVADADEERAAERRRDAREIEPVAHRLLRDREVLEVRVLVGAIGDVSGSELE